MKRIFKGFLLCVAGIVFSQSSLLCAEGPASCTFDRKALLAMDEQHFDQDLSNGGSGWRALSRKPECQLVAANLLRDYRAAHNTQSGILFWHEGQLRAMAGDYSDAIPLLEKSRKPIGDDLAGWNAYVDATVAFLKKDRPALDAARSQLADVKPDADTEVKDGFIEAHMADGRVAKFAWPPNLDVVDGLRRCFDKPYAAAYGGECRVPAHEINK
jgi:hypothetical protein